MRPRNAKSGGFTIIEILISLVLLMIGIVGILALFPIGIKNVNESVQESTAGNLAQSVYSALVDAMRRSDGSVATMTHDGLPFKAPSCQVTIDLASITTAAVMYPDPLGGRFGTHPTQETYQLGNNPNTVTGLLDVRKGDPTDPLTQFSYRFEILKPPEASIVVSTTGSPADLPLFAIRIEIYRSYYKFTPPSGTQHPALVKEMSAFVAGNEP